MTRTPGLVAVACWRQGCPSVVSRAAGDEMLCPYHEQAKPLRKWQAVPPQIECSTRSRWRGWGACVMPVDHDGMHADYEGRTWFHAT
jgi:hypothetical protein